MANYEMPVIVRLTKDELARALNATTDHKDVALLGGLNVVFHPMASEHSLKAEAGLLAKSAATGAVNGLKAALQPIEAQLLQHLRSNANIGKQFLLNPVGTLEQLGLIDATTRATIEGHAATIASTVTKA